MFETLKRAFGVRGPASPARDKPKPRASRSLLFDDEFQRKLETLALVSRRVFAGRMRAERRTKKSGSGVEFADHRDYRPAGDLRNPHRGPCDRWGGRHGRGRTSACASS